MLSTLLQQLIQSRMPDKLKGIWWVNHPGLFEKEKRLIAESFPGLSLLLESRSIYLRGELYLESIDDSYYIEIEIPDDYPVSIPILREKGGEIPHQMDRHINGDGTCCVCIKPAERLHWPTGSSIVDYVQSLVIPFLINQYHFDATGQWISGDYSHGDRGVYEFYAEHLNEPNPVRLLGLLAEAINPLMNKMKKCPCGSKKVFRKCHLGKVIFLKKNIDRSVLLKNYAAIQQLFPISIGMSK